MRPVVFFSEWLGVVISDPVPYEPSEENDDDLAYSLNEAPFGWDGVDTVMVYWFTEGAASEEFIDFLEIVSPPQDALDDPDYIEKIFDFHWTDEDE